MNGEPALRIRNPITFWTTEQMDKDYAAGLGPSTETLVDAIETGEVFAECGVPTASTSDVEMGETDVSERVVMLLEDFVHLVGGQRKLIDRLWASTVALTVMALASMAVNVYLLTGGAR